MTVTITKPSFNLRDALVSLKRKIGIKGAELMAAETAEDVYSVIGTNRNLIINGDFRISQRGDYTTATNISENTYYLDRWRGHNNSGAVSATFQQITTTINGVTKKAIRVQATSSSGGAYIGTTQIIEQINFPVGQPVTVSAWVRTNNPYTRFRYNGIGGSKNSPNTVPANGGWHKITWTIPDTSAVANNVTFWVICYSDSGNVPINTNDYFEVADYQVEIGTVATPFEHRPYGTELALCQRYCQQFTSPGQVYFLTGHVWSTTLCQYTFLPKVQMRTHPSLESGGTITNLSGQSSVNLSSISLDGAGLFAEGQQLKINATMSSSSFTSGYACALLINSAGAYIRFNAEL